VRFVTDEAGKLAVNGDDMRCIDDRAVSRSTAFEREVLDGLSREFPAVISGDLGWK
jgi:hypothetical protein